MKDNEAKRKKGRGLSSTAAAPPTCWREMSHSKWKYHIPNLKYHIPNGNITFQRGGKWDRGKRERVQMLQLLVMLLCGSCRAHLNKVSQQLVGFHVGLLHLLELVSQPHAVSLREQRRREGERQKHLPPGRGGSTQIGQRRPLTFKCQAVTLAAAW